MKFVTRSGYRGALKCAILDWAGTTVDYGVFAPAVVFLEVFRRQGVEITMAEARAPMGLHKKEHLRRIAQDPSVASRWRQANGREVRQQDIEAMYADFVPLQLACLGRYAALIPGTLQALADLRARGMKIGTTTGYTRAMVDVVLAEARLQGYAPDCTVAADEVPEGRPLPYACWKIAIELRVWPAEACVKFGDTVPDVEEGLNAGMWTVGLSLTGNEVGLSQQEVGSLSPEERQRRSRQAAEKLAAAGAHCVVEGIWDLPPVIDELNRRLAGGERP
jgi:phosphonoacetaldehyde hydrolase